jgi:hypothetical protein
MSFHDVFITNRIAGDGGMTRKKMNNILTDDAGSG